MNGYVSFQELIGALLACSFFCLFPIHKRASKQLPMINFGDLFAYVSRAFLSDLVVTMFIISVASLYHVKLRLCISSLKFISDICYFISTISFGFLGLEINISH